LRVDVVIPVYREKPGALAQTLRACLKQTFPVSKIYVVDDGSPVPVQLPVEFQSAQTIQLIRLPANQGISAARNAAIANSDSDYITCINSEVLPAPNWLEICLQYLARRPQVGACYARITPNKPERLLSRWRMRFHELSFGNASGPADFAPGHAVLFRRQAIDQVGGYDVRFRRIDEDSDICRRMKAAGWETHYVSRTLCVSTQEDRLLSLANKQLLRSNWASPEDYSVPRVFLDQTKWMIVRLVRNTVKLRLLFLPIDVAIWACALGMAASRSRQGARSRASSVDRGQPSGTDSNSRGGADFDPQMRGGTANDSGQVVQETPKA
jgi:glycosyltransferase involved in cell wall biosynthesis